MTVTKGTFHYQSLSIYSNQCQAMLHIASAAWSGLKYTYMRNYISLFMSLSPYRE